MASVDERLPEEGPNLALPKREPRPEPPIIEAQAIAEPHDAAPPPDFEAVGNASEIPASRAPSRSGSALGGILGGAVAGLFVAAAALYFMAPPDLSARLDRLDQTVQTAPSAIAALAARIDALEARAGEGRAAGQAIGVLASRVGALETRPVADAAPAAPDADALERRLGGLEAGLGALAPLGQRLDKVEAALAAPKSETRAAPDATPAPQRGAEHLAAAAILGEALDRSVDAGLAFEPELAALKALGGKAEDIAALQPFAAAGVPSEADARTQFANVAPLALKAVAPPPASGAMDRLMGELSTLVKTRAVGPLPGDSPEAAISQMQAALAEHNTAAALARAKGLPEQAKAPLQDWIAMMEARARALSAAQNLRRDSLKALTSG